MRLRDPFFQQIPDEKSSLPGRDTSIEITDEHFILKTSQTCPVEGNLTHAMFGMGCFWGAERTFWQLPGIYSTSVGYAGGYTPNPLYEEVCSGMTGHNEVVRVTFNPDESSYRLLLKTFWENHDPTQGMRQGILASGAAYRTDGRASHFEQDNTGTRSGGGFGDAIPCTLHPPFLPPFELTLSFFPFLSPLSFFLSFLLCSLSCFSLFHVLFPLSFNFSS